MNIEVTAPNAELAEASIGSVPLPQGFRLQEFEITGVIGVGGFGIVYQANDLALQRRVAIKEYMPAQLAARNGGVSVGARSRRDLETFELGLRSFMSEARLLARFKHRGLVEVLRFWEQNGTAYMVMPLYEGETLKQLIRRAPQRVTQDWLRAMLRPLLDALEHMHAAECFHRDVAPDNILVLADGSPILLDLGAARQVIGNRAQALTVMLKPGFAPIEQYADDPTLRQGAWTDVYALAAVAYFAITSRAPVASASRVLHDGHQSLASLNPPGYDQTLLRAIDHALAIRPEERPRSVAQFRLGLFATCDGHTEVSGAGSRTTRAAAGESAGSSGVAALAGDDSIAGDQAADASSTDSGRRGLLFGAVALAAVLAVGGWALFGSSRISEPDPVNAAASKVLPVVASVASTTQTPSSAPGPAPEALPAAPAADQASTDAASASAAVAAAATDAPAVTASASATATAAPASATVRLNVAPWAEVYVDGVKSGITPPLKRLTLSAGAHTIELRNPAGAPITRHVDVTGDKAIVVKAQF